MTTINAIVPVLLALGLAAGLRALRRRRIPGFWQDLGLVRPPLPAVVRAAVVAAVAVAVTLLVFDTRELRPLVTGPNTTVATVRAAGGGLGALWTLVVIATVQTALAEEILFRGAIAKPLMASLGFWRGNAMQALLFGAVHVALYASVARQPMTALAWLAIGAVPTGLAGSFAWLNERVGGGSIVPGWVAHALANLGAIGTMGFAWS